MEPENHLFEKENHLNQTFIFGFQPLIFRGVLGGLGPGGLGFLGSPDYEKDCIRGILIRIPNHQAKPPPAWPLVGNEGMKLYMVMMGIHSLIPY